MMKKFMIGMGLLVAVVAVRAGAQDALTVGSKAPKLAVSEWVKGEAVDGFKPGNLYVVEFWATWCGPCKTSIPHLTELQKKYPKVNFIGVSILEEDFSGVEPFVKEMGEKMDYRVAIDQVAAGESANEGKMAQGWMTAAGENGIPTSFIIDGDGMVAWIGHPMELDKPLEAVVAGTWNREEAASRRKAAKAGEQKMGVLMGKLQQAGSAKAAVGLLPEIEELIAADPEGSGQLSNLKFQILLATEPDKAASYASELTKSPLAENVQFLNYLAWTLIDPAAGRKPSKAALASVVEVATKACEASDWKDGSILDTLAYAEYLSGDLKKALEHQELAVKLSGDEAQAEMTERLEKYRKEAGGSK